MKIQLPSIFCIATMVLLFSSVDGNAQAVFSDYNTSVDFSKYKTFAWLAPGDSVYNKRRVDKVFGGLIMYSANQQLQKKGMTVDTTEPDAIFIFNTKVEEKVKYSQSPTLSVGVGIAGPGYYVGGSAPVAGGEITESSYENGMLSFDMYDAKTGDLLWSGGTTKSFTQADDIEKIITTSTDKIFRKFPRKNK
ncbi:MAG: DUF4136 domain-containing protein [Cyclobacteriaceae bacterium]|nr:DUF4136 domain-containing protein [Cyclobacteriaceae bacterium]